MTIDKSVKGTILEKWDVTPAELSEVIAQNPSLRGMILGYLAEFKLEKMWLSGSDISRVRKHDDHDREKKRRSGGALQGARLCL